MICQITAGVGIFVLLYRYLPFAGFSLYEREVLAEAEYCVKHREKKLNGQERCSPEELKTRIDTDWPAGERWCTSCYEAREQKFIADSLRAEQKTARLHAAAAHIAAKKFKKTADVEKLPGEGSMEIAAQMSKL